VNAQEFVEAVSAQVIQQMAPLVMSTLRAPTGQRPSAETMELSAWYKGLSVQDQAAVERLIRRTAHDTVHVLFSILDGAIRVDPVTTESHFELRHVHGEAAEILSGPNGAMLHELL
jgi:hypothetical protein